MKSEMITWEQYQEDVFNDLEDMKYEVQSLQGIVQNNFTWMLADGSITRDDILKSLPDAMNDFDQAISRLGKVKENVKEILEHHSLTDGVADACSRLVNIGSRSKRS